MADTKGSSGEERHLLDLLAKSALNDYPNPERVGCPGPEFLRTLAFSRKSIPLNDNRLDHVVHCSPCFRELTELKAAAKKRKTTIWASIGAIAAVVVIAVALWATGVLTPIASPGRSSSATIIARIDLQNRSITRGAPTAAQPSGPILIPKGRLKLTILLPFGSEAGTYDVQILKAVDKPLVAGSGQAAIVNGITTLNVSVNTSSLASGNYLLGVRQPPLDWAFNQIRIE